MVWLQPKDHEDSQQKQLAKLFGQTAEYLRAAVAVDPPGLAYLGADNADLRAAVLQQTKAAAEMTALYQDWKNQLAGDALSRMCSEGVACALSDAAHLGYYGLAPFCPFPELERIQAAVTMPRWMGFITRLVFEKLE